MKSYYRALRSLSGILIMPCIIGVMFTTISYAQKSLPPADTARQSTQETFKAYDFRGQGHKAAIDYALKHGGKTMPVIVDVQSRAGDTLLKITGKVMKKLDAQGYKNMALLAGDTDTISTGMLECALIYSNGSVYGLLMKGRSDNGTVLWAYYDKNRNILLKEYPKYFDAAGYIRKKIIEAYKNAAPH